MHLVGSCTNVCSSVCPREEAARGLCECVCRVYGGLCVCGRGLSLQPRAPGPPVRPQFPLGLKGGEL